MKLEVEDLRKHFGEKEVLKGVSFSVSEGQPLGLLGRNGAGKTTTIRTLMGIYPVESGQILLDGQPFDRQKYTIGYLPEERGLYQDITVLEQIIYIAKLRGLDRATAKEKGLEYLKKLQVDEYKDQELKTLSKGNQQKVQLAQTIVHDPKIVVLDEPFSGLDPVNSQILKDVIRELIAAQKIVIFSSHQMSYVEEFCKNICIINKGEAVLCGNLDTIKRGLGNGRIVVKADNYNTPQLLEQVKKITPNCDILKDEVIVSEDKNSFLAKILATDIDIKYVKMYEPSLEDIFVSKVGDVQCIN